MRRPASTPPVLPGYTFVRLLGSGGFSDVFLYEQELPRRRVAVKVLLLDELTPANRAAFVAEANLMAQLSAHPYIVTIYHADVASDARPYFVMEYCSGPSLGDRYKQAPFAVADALRTGVRLSSAVHTAHLSGILHRDIKPANVLSNDYGWPALTDFGISSAVDDALPTHTTTVAEALGGTDTGTGGTSGQVGLSVPWSPAEMFEDDPKPDVRTEVFSLAATIWTVLAGQTPFEVRGRGNSTLDLIGRIERGSITPMDRTDVPRSLIAVLQKGMATEREDRFASALDFGRALQRVEMELGYARTELEVPNLQFDAPQRPADTGGDDETRVRQVATIDAQPLESLSTADETRARQVTTVAAQPLAQPIAPPAAPSDPRFVPASGSGVADALPSETIVRSRGPVAEPPTVQQPQQQQPHAQQPAASASAFAPDPAATPAPAPAPAAPRSRAALVVGLVVSAVAVLVVVAVVVGIVVFGGERDEPVASGETAKPVPTAAVPVRIEPPVLVDAPTLDGSTVVFTVENPDVTDGDTLIWMLNNRPDRPEKHAVGAGGEIRAEDYSGGTLCIDVFVVRKGKTSDPLTSCYPPA